MSGERISLTQTLAIQIVIWIVAALMTYGAMNARVSVVESRMEQFREDIREIKADVKALLRKP